MPGKLQKRIHRKDSWPGSGPSWSTARFHAGHKFMYGFHLERNPASGHPQPSAASPRNCGAHHGTPRQEPAKLRTCKTGVEPGPQRLHTGAWMCAFRPPSILSALRHHQHRRFGAMICAVNPIAPGRAPHRTPGYAAWVAVWPDGPGDGHIGGGGKGIAESMAGSVWTAGPVGVLPRPLLHGDDGARSRPESVKGPKTAVDRLRRWGHQLSRCRRKDRQGAWRPGQ